MLKCGLATQQNDPGSMKIYDEVTCYLYSGLSNLVNLLNPKTIFVGGGVSFSGDFFFELLNDKIVSYLLRPNSKITILPVSFGEYATAIGAVSVVLDEILDFEL
jgi:predicted NBD/HSP70 family sugar kinase